MNLEHCLAIAYSGFGGQSGIINTYYIIDLDALEIFEQWYLELDCLLLDSGLEITKQNLQYKILSQDEDQYFVLKNFIESFGTPWELLEQIDGLEQMFTNNVDQINNSDSDTDSDLYTQTETIGQIISAHINGDISKVKELLGSSGQTCLDDEVISNIKNKYI